MVLVWFLLPLVAYVNADCHYSGKTLKNEESTVFISFVLTCVGDTMKVTHCLFPDKVTRLEVGKSLVQGDTRSSCLIEKGAASPTFRQTSQSKWQSENLACEEGKPVGSNWTDSKYSYVCENVADEPKKTITACVMEGGSTLNVGETKIVSTKNYECKKHANGDVELIVAEITPPPTTKQPAMPDIPDIGKKCNYGIKEYTEGQEYMLAVAGGDGAVLTCLSGEMKQTACALDGKKLDLGEYRVKNEDKKNYTCIRHPADNNKVKLTGPASAPLACDGGHPFNQTWDESNYTMMCTPEAKALIIACKIDGFSTVPVGETKEKNSKNYECKTFADGTVSLIVTEIMDGRTMCAVGNGFRVQNTTWNDDELHYTCTFNTEKKKPEVITLGCNKKNSKNVREVILIGQKKEIDSVSLECVKFPNGTIALVREAGKHCLDKHGDEKDIDQTWLDLKQGVYGFKLKCFPGGEVRVIECIHERSNDYIKVGESKQYDTVLFECKKFSNGTVWLVQTELSCKDEKGTVRKPDEKWEIVETRVTWECKNGKPRVLFCKYDHFGSVNTLQYLGRYRVFEKEQRCEEKGMVYVEAKLGG